MSERQADANDLSQAARNLLATDFVRADPTEIREILEEITQALEPLTHTAARLSRWHSRAVRGNHYAATQNANEAVEDAATQLLATARFLAAARDAARAGAKANSTVRWRRQRSPLSPDRES